MLLIPSSQEFKLLVINHKLCHIRTLNFFIHFIEIFLPVNIRINENSQNYFMNKHFTIETVKVKEICLITLSDNCMPSSNTKNV
ncbi:hypothetical protein BLOT_013300 [Blomia tropicalis]|nr:hypothetical protein BLOT_013300 [Blomia tropicalis]